MADEEEKARLRKAKEAERRANMRAMMRARRGANQAPEAGGSGDAEIVVAGGGSEPPVAVAVSSADPVVVVAAAPVAEPPAAAETKEEPVLVAETKNEIKEREEPPPPQISPRGLLSSPLASPSAAAAAVRDFPQIDPVSGSLQVSGDSRREAGVILARIVEAAAQALADAEIERRESLPGAAAGMDAETVVRRLREAESGDGQPSLFSAAELLETDPAFSEKDADKLRFTAFRRGVEATRAAGEALAAAKKSISDEEVVTKSMTELQTFGEKVLAEAATASRSIAAFAVPEGERDTLGIIQALLENVTRASESVRDLEVQVREADAALAQARAVYERSEASRAQRDLRHAQVVERQRDVDADFQSLKERAERSIATANTKSAKYRSGVEGELGRLQARLAQENETALALKLRKDTLDRDNRAVHAVFDEIVRTHQGIVDANVEQDEY
jgi:hypothetical protein